jgi:hypothetical protein
MFRFFIDCQRLTSLHHYDKNERPHRHSRADILYRGRLKLTTPLRATYDSCAFDMSQPLSTEGQPKKPAIHKKNIPRVPSGHPTEEISAAFYAKVAVNVALQELWFSVMVRRSLLLFTSLD